MPKFTVEHPTQQSPADTYAKLKDFFSKGEELKKFDPKVDCVFNDQNQTCQLNGSQFKAEVKILAQPQGSIVNVHIDLPFLLTPFKGKIQEGLGKMLKRHLG